MPVYPGRKKGTHRVTVWANNKQNERVVQGSRSQALEAEARMRIELRARPAVGHDPTLWDFLTVTYAAHARVHLGPRTWKNGRKYQVATLAEFFGDLRLSELTTLLVQSYAAERAQHHMATTVNNELRTLSAVLKYAREDCGLYVPAVKIRKLKEPERRVRAWSPAEVAKLLATCRRKDPRLLPLVIFLLNTGCRKGEAIAALWSWVDERTRMLRITPSATWAPKTRRPREVPLSDAVWSVLEGLPRTGPHIFPNVGGIGYVKFPDARFLAVKRAAKLTGGPHTLRHTFASMFLAARPDMPTLARILGHSALRTTELYAHLLPGHLEGARNVVNVSYGLARVGRRQSA